MRDRRGGAGSVLLEVLASRRSAAERELVRRMAREREEAERVEQAVSRERELDAEGRELEAGRPAALEADVHRYRSRRDGLRAVRSDATVASADARQRHSLARARVAVTRDSLAGLSGRERALARLLSRGGAPREDEDD